MEARRDQAITDLTELVAGRTDLLAQEAGVALGFQDCREGVEAATIPAGG